jgi:outer membrane lipoprotein-sorting protein
MISRQFRITAVPLSLFALLVTGLFCSGCVSQYKVVVDFSPELRDHFNQFPTIEVDIAAVTDSEAAEVQKAGVEKYFSPDSGFRKQFHSQTCFFDREEQYIYVLPSRAPVWKTWLLKEPTSLLVIASLPPDSSADPQADPRYLVIKMAQSFVLARTVNIMVEPDRIVQLARTAKTKGDKDSAEAGQYIETRQGGTK